MIEPWICVPPWGNRAVEDLLSDCAIEASRVARFWEGFEALNGSDRPVLESPQCPHSGVPEKTEDKPAFGPLDIGSSIFKARPLGSGAMGLKLVFRLPRIGSIERQIGTVQRACRGACLVDSISPSRRPFRTGWNSHRGGQVEPSDQASPTLISGGLKDRR